MNMFQGLFKANIVNFALSYSCQESTQMCEKEENLFKFAVSRAIQVISF